MEMNMNLKAQVKHIEGKSLACTGLLYSLEKSQFMG